MHRLFVSRPRALIAGAVLSLALSGGAFAQTTATSSTNTAPNGKRQALKPHRVSHAVIRSLLAPPARQTAAAKVYGGTPIDVLTYHYDNYRTGWNPTETDLTPATVKSGGKFGLLATLAVDGNVFAQPLLVTNFVMPDKTTHDVLIIATGHDSVYAFDAQTFAQLWRVSMGTPQSSTDVGCSDIQPEYGVSSTPVIVRSSASAASIYLVAATEPVSMQFHTQLHRLNLANGKDVLPPVEISPSATLSNGGTLNFDPQNQWNRASLALANNKYSLYIGIGSHCDNNADGISGWLLHYDNRLNYLNGFHTIETPHGYELSSIWMAGFAPAIDPSGNVFVVTGNGDFTGGGARDWGEAVLKIGPGVAGVLSWFVPTGYQTLNFYDRDFGSGGVMLLPPVAGQTAPPMAVAMGKDAVMYLLNQNSLGGLRANDSGALQSTRLHDTGEGVWGGPAYYAGPGGPTVFYQVSFDYLRAFSLSTGATPSLTATVVGSTQAGQGGSFPIVSSNGATANTGVVWLQRRTSPVELEAYDASALGAPIYSAALGTWSNSENNSFLTPMEANGRVYAPGYLSVMVFGLTQ